MRHWLRWFAVLPGAVLGGLLAIVALRFVLYSTLRSVIEPYPEWPERVLTPFAMAVGFVWIGARIAPSRKLATAVVLFGLWMVLLGAALGFALFGTMPKGTQLNIPAGGLPIVLAFVGGLLGVLLVRRDTPRPVSGPGIEQNAG